MIFTEGGRESGSGGFWRGSSSIGNVEKVNCGVWVYFQSSDCLEMSVSVSGIENGDSILLTRSSSTPFLTLGSSA